MGYGGETALAIALTGFSTVILLLLSVVPTSTSGTMIGYARLLSDFCHLSLWQHRKLVGRDASASDQSPHSTPYKCIVVRYIIFGPTVLGLSTLALVPRKPTLMIVVMVLAAALGSMGIYVTRAIVDQVPDVIMRRGGVTHMIWFLLVLLMAVAIQVSLVSILIVLSNLGRPPTWPNFIALLMAWFVCLHWQIFLVLHCFGRTPKSRLWYFRDWAGLAVLNELTLAAIHRSGRKKVRNLLTYEPMPPALDVDSHDLAAIAALIVPEGAVIREPDQSTERCLLSGLWRRESPQPQQQPRNTWLIDPGALIADGTKVKGEDLRHFLMRKAAEFMEDDGPSTTRPRQEPGTHGS